jgi:NAD+ kinase
MTPLRQLGLVVHPTRSLEWVLEELRGWASRREVAVGQVRVAGQTREVAEPVVAEECELLVALGGDGTTLNALHPGAPSSRAVLGIACGSVGVLTSVAGDRVGEALDQVEAGSFDAVDVPGLEVSGADGRTEIAINDLTVIRDGPGQLLVSVVVDDVVYGRLAGDGLVVATALGSSAYTMAAGGPILAPGAEGIAVTPLAPHGGSIPPLVAGPDSRIELRIDPGHGGVRHEIDGRLASLDGELVTARARASYATLVRLGDEEPRLSGLRRRGLVVDSPRVLVRDARPGQRPL